MAWFKVLLRAVPWGALLANGPGIVRAADAVRQRSRGAQSGPTTADELRALNARLASIETTQVEMSEVIQRLAEENQKLAEAAGALAVRVRWLLAGVVAAVVLAIAAIVAAVL